MLVRPRHTWMILIALLAMSASAQAGERTQKSGEQGAESNQPSELKNVHAASQSLRGLFAVSPAESVRIVHSRLGSSPSLWILPAKHDTVEITKARYPSGKGEVCKTFMRGFDSHPRLQLISSPS